MARVFSPGWPRGACSLHRRRRERSRIRPTSRARDDRGLPMRTLLLAAACLFGLVGASRGDFDAAGAAPSKPATGATFGGVVASKRPARKVVAADEGTGNIVFAVGAVIVKDGNRIVSRVRIPRTYRPANVPSMSYTDQLLIRDLDGRMPIRPVAPPPAQAP
jgi:hypothetical protein